MNSLTNKIKNLKSWLIDVRRDLHKTPELGLEEFLTKEKIIKYLEEIGIDYITYPDHTGIMAYINKNAKNTVPTSRGNSWRCKTSNKRWLHGKS